MSALAWRIASIVVLTWAVAGCTRRPAVAAKLDEGCTTPSDCEALLEEARADLEGCMERPTIGYVTCSAARAAVTRATGMLNRAKAAERESREARAEAERRARQKEAEAEEVLRAEQRDVDLADAWTSLDLAACSRDLVAERCDELAAFAREFQGSEEATLAQQALQVGRATIFEREQKRLQEQLEAARAADEAARAEEERQARARSTSQGQSQTAAPASDRTRYLLCRDGTTSPSCVCGGPRRGCCSRHGGVAGCEP